MITGFGPSPYLVTRVRGTWFDPKNLFQLCKVILNLPGMDNYDLSRPLIFKL